jgi:multidrug efflux system membrane fusion protein
MRPTLDGIARGRRAGWKRSGRCCVLAPVGFAALLFALTGCSRKDAARGAPGGDGANRTGGALPVNVAIARLADVPVQLTGIGTVQAYSTVAVKSRVPGALARVGFRQGEEVRAGDLIFLIDPRPYQAALEQARANLERDRALLAKAEADFRRNRELLTNNIISPADFDQSRADVDSLKATLLADAAAITNAEVQLSYCSIQSPISGRIGTLLVNEGNMVKDIDTVLAVINQVRPIYVDFFIPEQHLTTVREHMRDATLNVEATLPGYADHRAAGRLLMINNQVDPATGTILLRAEFPNVDEMLWPGQYVNVALTLTTRRNAVVIPAVAVQLGQKGRYVCVVRPDETVEFRDVEVGDSFGRDDVINQGLHAGERVITSGQLRLLPGSKVQIVTSPGDGKAAGGG